MWLCNNYSLNTTVLGFTGGVSHEQPACQCRRRKRHRFNPWVRKIPWRRARQPTPVFLSGEPHGQSSLAGYGPQGHKQLETTEATWHHCIMIGQQKNTTILYHQNYQLIKNLSSLFKSRCISELPWNILYKHPGILFFLQSSKYVSNEQPRLKSTWLYDDLLLLSSLFYIYYFIFSVISFSLYFPISPSLFFWIFFLKPLSSVVEKLLYNIYIYIVCITYIFYKTCEILPN